MKNSSLVMGEGERIVRNSTCKGPESGKSLINIKKLEVHLRDYAKTDNEVHLEKWGGARCVWHDWNMCCELWVLLWVTIGGLWGRE